MNFSTIRGVYPIFIVFYVMFFQKKNGMTMKCLTEKKNVLFFSGKYIHIILRKRDKEKKLRRVRERSLCETLDNVICG